MSEQKAMNNPLICDPMEGFCGIEEPIGNTKIDAQQIGEGLKLIYFTDPICSSCWAIEPQLRKLKLEYGKYLEIDYRMGGLLPDWSYNSGGISKASDVAEHWDEASVHYDMPIDGDLWLEDPLNSSYPPSIAFKAAQIQDEELAVLYLRELREILFLEKKNIAKWEHLEAAGRKVGLDTEQLRAQMDEQGKTAFEDDLKLAKAMGVRGFPTMFFVDNKGNKELLYGAKAYAFYEMAILKLQPMAVKSEYSRDWESLFSKFPSLTAKEFSLLSGTPRLESETLLNGLSEKKLLKKMSTKNGAIWRK